MKTMRWFVLVAAVSASTYVWGAPVDRIKTPVDDRVRLALRGNVPPATADAIDQGAVAASMPLSRITLFFNRTAAQQAELDALLEQQQDPSSPNYHQWLTLEQVADRFGVSASDIAKTAQWLQRQGFTIIEQPPSRAYIAFSGTAAQVSRAFGTEIHSYVVKGVTHFANSTDPVLPRALADVTMGIRGLHDFRPKARGIRTAQPRFTSSISGNHFLVPDDFATIYHLKPLYDQGVDGTGQWLAVMGQTDIPLADIANFRNLSGLPPNVPVVQLIPGGVPGVSNSDIGEADLDVEWAGAVARKATIIYVNAGTGNLGAFDSLSYAINNTFMVGGQSGRAQVLSISYGNCESNWTASEITSFTSQFQQANAQGQTVLGPSGDAGAADCESSTATTATHGLAVDFPASSAFVTGVGGTMFNEGANASLYWSAGNNSFNGSALSYIPEMVWNETSANQGVIVAAGGGISTMLVNGNPNSKPVWQMALTPADNKRDVPDISLAAGFIHDGFLICASNQSPLDCTNGFRDSNNNLDAIGGTSAGVPAFAGMIALLNQKEGTTQGNVNPALYALAAISTDAFRDITTGSNIVPCSPGFAFTLPNGGGNNGVCPPNGQIGYSAGPSYDYATGLGSVDAYNLISELANHTISTPPAPDFTVNATTSTTVTLAHGNSTTYTVAIAGMNGFTGTVTFSCIVPTSLAGVTCTPPSPMTAPANATFTITASSTAKLIPPGASPTFLAWNWGGGTLIAGLLLGAGERSKKKARNLRAILLAGALLVLLLVALVGCGGGTSSIAPAPTPPPPFTPESGIISLQGVSGANVHWAAITLNVN